jgi:hypothetical protein
MKTKLFLLFAIGLLSNHSFAQYTYQKPVEHSSVDIDRESKFEVGFHYGLAWTSGDVREYAKYGSAFSLDLGANSGNFYFGTEFTLTSWQDYNDTGYADEINFEETNFLWLIHAKVFLGDGKVKPYFGLGTDLITIALGIIDSEDEEDSYYSESCDDNNYRDYNAWLVPSVGIRWEMGPDISGNIGFSANFSRNYDFIRLQVGIVF